MYLIYYIKNKERSWIMAETETACSNFVKKNEIEDYYITVNDRTYEQMKNKIESQEKKINNIKKTLEKISKEV